MPTVIGYHDVKDTKQHATTENESQGVGLFNREEVKKTRSAGRHEPTEGGSRLTQTARPTS